MKSLYIRVTSDKYQLPVAVADSAREMAEMQDVNWNSVMQIASFNKHGKKRGSFFRVTYTDEEWEDS